MIDAFVARRIYTGMWYYIGKTKSVAWLTPPPTHRRVVITICQYTYR